MKLESLPYKKILTLLAMIVALVFLETALLKRRQAPLPEEEQIASVGLATEREFLYTFATPGVLEESGNLQESRSPYWWLNSGGRLYIADGIGRTAEEDNAGEKWRRLYKASSPEDTDEGEHPQNIFRLLTKSKWESTRQEVKFKLEKIILSESENRNDSNGVLLMQRYQDRDNLYYAGVRVDGNAVVKKKKEGNYYTLAITPLFYSEALYNRDTTPNIIPGQKWIGIRSEVTTDTLGRVHISFSADKQNNGSWQKVIDIVDSGQIGGAPIVGPGLSGIRTDFLEAEFDDFRIVKI
jgi:hypothetical protein